jgi:hypothetical protein
MNSFEAFHATAYTTNNAIIALVDDLSRSNDAAEALANEVVCAT